MNATEAQAAARDWIDAWNAHDARRVVDHFTDDVVVSSPLAAERRPGSNGTLHGKEAVLAYYEEGLALAPDLRFTLVAACVGIGELVIVYRNQGNLLVTESMRFDRQRHVVEVRVCHAVEG
jgi:hypothetical protein